MSTWKGKTRGGNIGYLFFIFIIRYLGVTVAYGLLWAIIPYFIFSAPRATASVWVYSRKILKLGRIESVGMLFRNYYRLGQILIDKVAVNNGFVNKYQFCFDGYDEFLEVLNSNIGVVMIGAHVGNWEIGTPFFDRYGKKINIVMYDAEHERIKAILKKNSLTKNFKIIPVNEDNLTHVFKIADALSNKEYVCFQGDRFLNSEKLLTCTFMGWKASFPAGPFLLASRMKTPVVFYFATRERRKRYRFHFTLMQKNLRIDGISPQQAVLEQYVNTLEKTLKKYPEQWFNYYRFWEDA